MRDNCLGPDSIAKNNRKLPLKSKKFIPLSERTKTLQDLQGSVNEIDEMDVNNVKYKQANEKNRVINDPGA